MWSMIRGGSPVTITIARRNIPRVLCFEVKVIGRPSKIGSESSALNMALLVTSAVLKELSILAIYSETIKLIDNIKASTPDPVDSMIRSVVNETSGT